MRDTRHDAVAPATGSARPRRVSVIGGSDMFKAIADVLRAIGGAIATVVTLPFRLVARLFGGVSDSAHGRH